MIKKTRLFKVQRFVRTSDRTSVISRKNPSLFRHSVITRVQSVAGSRAFVKNTSCDAKKDFIFKSYISILYTFSNVNKFNRFYIVFLNL